MTVITPPLYLNVDATYGAADLGLPWRDVVAEGVAGTTDLAVSERGAGANMSVDVAAGVAWIRGDDADTQPCYRVYNDGTVNLAVAAADGTNPRVDLVVAEVRDSVFSGVSNDWRLRVVTGTPAGSPATPATPDNAIALATVSVPATDTTIGTAQITDVRPRAGLAGGALGVPIVTALPVDPYDGQVVDFLADSSTGALWRLRYYAAEAGSYKWYFVGGTPKIATADTNSSRTNTAYGALASDTPTLALPALAGDFRVAFGAGEVNWTGNGQVGYVKPGASAPGDDTKALVFYNYNATSAYLDNMSLPAHRENVLTGLSASATLRLYWRATGGTISGAGRFIHAVPVRVG